MRQGQQIVGGGDGRVRDGPDRMLNVGGAFSGAGSAPPWAQC
jgi:hypothetical protein